MTSWAAKTHLRRESDGPQHTDATKTFINYCERSQICERLKHTFAMSQSDVMGRKRGLATPANVSAGPCHAPDRHMRKLNVGFALPANEPDGPRQTKTNFFQKSMQIAAKPREPQTHICHVLERRHGPQTRICNACQCFRRVVSNFRSSYDGAQTRICDACQ